MIFLEDDRLRLRPVEPEDASFMSLIEADSSQWIENSLLAPYSKENMQQYALTYDSNPFSSGQLRLIIENKDSSRQIGAIDLYEISAQHRRALVGIYIMKSERNNGYAKRSLKLLESYAFKLLNLVQLGAKIAETNLISTILFKNAGYSLRGTLPDWLISGNKSIGMNVFTKKLTDKED